MTLHNSSLHKIEKIGAISGILSIIFYVSAILPFLPDSLGRLVAFTFPLLWIISFMGLYHFLRKQNHTPSLEIAYIFGIIGGMLACTLLIVQQANIMWHQEVMETANTDEIKALYKATFRGANRVQAGLDVAFDVFITISWFLFGLNIAKSKSFNRLLGWTGSLIALSLLVLNFYTFPDAPAESGLFDLGPFLGLWVLVFFIWFTIILYKKKNNPDHEKA
jgi:hypothetical protein